MSALAVLLVGVGGALVGWGMRALSSGRRPLDLVGALAAGLGVAIAAAGATGLVARGFLG